MIENPMVPALPDPLTRSLASLRCPHCQHGLRPAPGGAACMHGHHFDAARQGYLSLLTGAGRAGDGDTAAMVAARHEALSAGHYSPIADALAEDAARLAAGTSGCVADIGAGTGHYLAAVLDRLPGRLGLALDISRYALRRAARAHPRAAAVRCDAWAPLPVRTNAVALALDVFAPRNPAELRRVLAPDGGLLLVTPTRRHLAELVAPLGLVGVDTAKPRRLADTLGGLLRHEQDRPVDFRLRLSHHDAATLIGMGPSAHHLDPDTIARRLTTLPDPVRVTASVTVSTYRA